MGSQRVGSYHPSGSFNAHQLFRANEDAILPLSQPIKGINGKEIREIPVPKGTNVSVSLLAANRDPDLWGPDALEWKPERWLKSLPDALVDAHVPGIYSHL